MELARWGAPSLVEPTGYPGLRPAGSFLLDGERVRTLDVQPGRRLGLARVGCEDPLEVVHLDRLLFQQGEATMGERVGVLAIGSNAAPAQLAHKLARASTSRVVPVTAATVEGLELAFGAIVGFYGVIPAAVRAAPGTSLATWITWLDPEQCALVDRTEPGYRRVELGAHQATIVEGSGERLGRVCVYRWLGRLVRIGDVVPVPAIPTEHPATGERSDGPGWSQVEVWQRVLEQVSPTTTPPSLGATTAELRALDDALGLSARLDRDGVEDGLDALDGPDRPATYDEQPSSFEELGTEDGVLVARSSSSYAAAVGRPPRAYCAFVPPELLARYGGGLVEVTPAAPSLAGHRRTFAQLVGCELVPAGSVGLDITLRIALGIASLDLVRLAPLAPAGHGPGSRVFPTRGTFARVVTSDASIAEMSSCYLSPGMMAFIGVTDGQHVVVSHPNEGRLRSVRVRAFALPEDVKDQRAEIERPRWTSTYPRCIDLLGVQSDFSPIYLDAEDRARLGVERCGAVQVMADWRDQVGGASRDISLLVVVAAFGLATLGEGSSLEIGGVRVSLAIVLVVLFAAVTAGLVFWSVRRRLE